MALTLVKNYTWTENIQQLTVTVPIRRAVKSETDIFVTEKYVKIKYANYFCEIFLKSAIDYEKCSAKIGSDDVKLVLTKRKAGIWGELEERFPANETKQDVIRRRQTEIANLHKLHSESRERRSERRNRLANSATKHQLKFADEEMRRILNEIEKDKEEVLTTSASNEDNGFCNQRAPPPARARSTEMSIQYSIQGANSAAQEQALHFQ